MLGSGGRKPYHHFNSKQFEEEITEYFRSGDDNLRDKERYARRIIMTLDGIVNKLGYSGKIRMFGSFSNGFMNFSSDLDLVLLVDRNDVHLVLARLASKDAGLSENGFENVTQIFSANVPLLKFTDIKRKVEVDLCINNELGLRNSQLLSAYCSCDPRVQKLGRLVKDWAKAHELVGPADGCLNSYAYMLLVIFYLQGLDPPVVENLQEKASRLCVPPKKVADRKWGNEKQWDTRFWEKPPEPDERSRNTMAMGELLMGFFDYYSNPNHGFDWQLHAVCIRLHNKLDMQHVDKFSLETPCASDQWYVEDPFDLWHNLAGKCTANGRRRILDAMAEAFRTLRTGHGWYAIQPKGQNRKFFLKCRVTQGATPVSMLEAFQDFGLETIYYPDLDSGSRPGQAYLQFNTAMDRRRAHTRNETYVADCQLQLHLSTFHSLQEAKAQGIFYTEYMMASLRLQQQAAEESKTHLLSHREPPPSFLEAAGFTMPDFAAIQDLQSMFPAMSMYNMPPHLAMAGFGLAAAQHPYMQPDIQPRRPLREPKGQLPWATHSADEGAGPDKMVTHAPPATAAPPQQPLPAKPADPSLLRDKEPRSKGPVQVTVNVSLAHCKAAGRLDDQTVDALKCVAENEKNGSITLQRAYGSSKLMKVPCKTEARSHPKMGQDWLNIDWKAIEMCAEGK